MASFFVTNTEVEGLLWLARSYNVCLCGGGLQLASHIHTTSSGWSLKLSSYKLELLYWLVD